MINMKMIILAFLMIATNAVAMNTTQELPVLQEHWGSQLVSNPSECQQINARLPMRCDELRLERNSVATYVCDSLFEFYGNSSSSFLITYVGCRPGSGFVGFTYEIDKH